MTVREAATCVHNAWLDGRSLEDGMLQIRMALSEPDPVFEAWKIIAHIQDITSKRQLPLTVEINELCTDWLKRNGGAE